MRTDAQVLRLLVQQTGPTRQTVWGAPRRERSGRSCRRICHCSSVRSVRCFARSVWDIGTTPFVPWWEIEGIRSVVIALANSKTRSKDHAFSEGPLGAPPGSLAEVSLGFSEMGVTYTGIRDEEGWGTVLNRSTTSRPEPRPKSGPAGLREVSSIGITRRGSRN